MASSKQAQITKSHASIRAQQRGIPPHVVDWLVEYGEREWDHHGAVVLYLTKRSRAKIEAQEGHDAIRKNHEHLNSYAVMSVAGTLITCGHRFKKICRH